MITREILREIADFQANNADAITFYYQPVTPQDHSHRQETILVKDLVKENMRRSERSGKNGTVRADLERILTLAERLHGNQGRAKAIFACGAQNYWREIDFPTRAVPFTKLSMNSRFHLAPLSAALGESLQKTCVCLVDRSRARFFLLEGQRISEAEGFVDELSRPRTDGFEGYNAGHVERKLDNEAVSHFKRVAEKLLERYTGDCCDKVLIGCRDELWPAIEKQLHPYVKQRLIGQFLIDPAITSPEEVRQHAVQAVRNSRELHRANVLGEVLDEARANNRGALGLRRVLRAMEQGEVQVLLLASDLAAEGVECTNCGHIDIRMVHQCAVCGQQTRVIEDLPETLIGKALRSGIEVMHIPASDDFRKAGNIGALLRFRADRSVGGKLA